ncbi:hypothetical protein [Pseudoalteromonas sp. Angola-7]|uniref:hypothetical protein n=1 Tax=Pseudoalteromonas sp. Angola-7 TaxID=3025336 RepID=UPI002359023B|nr:hypothetical protein [Pseudoalteromonas sp. Angola-7]MDC9529169.1 hypothetical protein [Pseudoalteromonas sp. Angola-7]
MNRKSIKIWEWYISHNELYNKEIKPELEIEIIKTREIISKYSKSKINNIKNLIEELTSLESPNESLENELEEKLTGLKTIFNRVKPLLRILDKTIWDNYLARIRKLKFNNKRITISINKGIYSKLKKILNIESNIDEYKDHDHLFEQLIAELEKVEHIEPITLSERDIGKSKISIVRPLTKK